MDKSIQITEASKQISTDSPGMANKGRGQEGEDSFFNIITQSTGEADGTESGQKLPASGEKLPEQESRVNDQQYAGEASPANLELTDASAIPDVVEEPVPTVAMNLPELVAVQIPGEHIHVPDVPDALAIDGSGSASAADVTQQPVNAGELLPARTAEMQLQGQVLDLQALAKAVPGNLVVPNGQGQQDSIVDVGDVTIEVASSPAAANGGRISSDTGPVANALRVAVQLAIANQTLGRDFKQFLQQNGNDTAATNLLPVSDSAETQAMPFLQTISDSALLMPSARIAVPVGQPGWNQALGTQVAWFVSQNISAASLRLNPQHLGPMEVEVSLDGDKASINFTSQQGMVREALESAIPRLREMLSENGLNLVNVNISQQDMSRQNGQSMPGSRYGANIANTEGGGNEEISGLGTRQTIIYTQGLVDFYA
jgi:flagellar hook-length control protein FliK